MTEKYREVLEKMAKYNPWGGSVQATGYERREYLVKITPYMGTRLVKVLVGQRRSGKSYLMRQVIRFLNQQKKVDPRNIFYLNKEYTAFDEIRTHSDLEALFLCYKKEMQVNGKIFLFLDEVQDISSWELFVNSYAQDFTEDYELVVSGSNSRLLSGEMATLLSGRYVEMEIFPFSYFEFAEVKEMLPGKESYLEYLKTGGLPEMLQLEGEEMRRGYLTGLKNTVILRDIVERYTIRDLPQLEEIFKFLMSNIGSLTSVSNIVSYFKSRQKKSNYETVSAYIRYLTDAFLFHQADRYHLKGKQVLGGSSKYYLNDLAFKNILLGVLPTDLGHHLENLVYLQLKSRGYDVRVGILNNMEIDFVAQKSGIVLYFQVCYQLNSDQIFRREFGNLFQINDNHPKYVISLDDVKFTNYEGIVHLRPWELGDLP